MNKILCYTSCWNETLPPADDAGKWEDVIIKDVLITARDPSVTLPLCAADYSSPSQLSLKCPSQITDCTAIHHTPAQHAPHISISPLIKTLSNLMARRLNKNREKKYIIYQDTRKQNCLCACQRKTEGTIMSDRIREKRRASGNEKGCDWYDTPDKREKRNGRGGETWIRNAVYSDFIQYGCFH